MRAGLRSAARAPLAPLLAALLAAAAGGQERGVAIHVPELPPSLDLALDGTAVGRAIHAEVHDTLLALDPATLELVPSLCEEVRVEDAVYLAVGSEVDAPPELLLDLPGSPAVLLGRVTDTPGGPTVTSHAGPGAEPAVLSVDAEDVERIEHGTVFTLRLRDGVRWHDGHELDAADVLFSREIYSNPEVRCDARRFLYEKLVHGEELDRRTVRFVYAEQYFKAAEVFATLCLLPSHLYDLTDPDHPRHDPDADRAARAREINENPANRDWVGLGPYEVVDVGPRTIRARRFAGHRDPVPEGRVSSVTWRSLTSDTVATAALLDGVVDFSDRLEVADLPALEAEGFRTGHFHRGRYGFVAWNLRRGKLADVRVRRALAHAFDFESFDRALYDGHAVRVTGPQSMLGPAYDRFVEPLSFDLAKAEALLLEAGWFDRDGDGRVDRSGEPLEIELLLPAGNEPGERVGLLLQEAAAELGVGVELARLDLASLLARVRERRFDAVLLAWTQPLESDPEQKWHSRWADVEGSSNLPGLADARVDRLVERGQRELDAERRHGIWRELHRRLHELQPYLFLYNAPVVYALDADVRGFRPTPVPPNYRVRDWWIADEGR